MKANKALKRLAKIEAWISVFHDRWLSRIAPYSGCTCAFLTDRDGPYVNRDIGSCRSGCFNPLWVLRRRT